MFREKVPCRYCHQTGTVKKHGTARSGHQRYMCSSCNRTFQVKYIYHAYKLNEEKKPQLITRPQKINIISEKENNIVRF